jgi:hypothetical protein
MLPFHARGPRNLAGSKFFQLSDLKFGVFCSDFYVFPVFNEHFFHNFNFFSCYNFEVVNFKSISFITYLFKCNSFSDVPSLCVV